MGVLVLERLKYVKAIALSSAGSNIVMCKFVSQEVKNIYYLMVY